MAERHHDHPPTPAARTDAPAVELAGITKAYPGVLANDHVDLAVRRGEVHCLLGENGAGKSTLMGILAGMVSPDAGVIRVDGREVRIDSPKRALELGIGMVYQHTTLVPTLSVVENLMLGAHEGLRLDVAGARERLGELSGMLGVELDPDAEAGSMSLGQQQQIEIVKALWRGSEVLILDEPTSMLTPQGVAELAKVLVRLKGQGLAVVLITHKLHEATSQGDRVSILKAGRVVGALSPEDLAGRSADDVHGLIVGMMFGDQVRVTPDVVELQERPEGHAPRRRLEGEPILELDDVTVTPRLGEVGVSQVSLALLPGEIMGMAGVDGNGQRELAEAIAGQRPLAGGEVRFAGASLRRMRLAQRERLGLRYVTDDRLGEGTVGPLSVGLNLVLKRIGQAPFWRRGSIQRKAIDDNARALIADFDIRTPGPASAVATLSGGNIQKVVLARELSNDARVVIYNKPTYGLDLRTTQAVRARIREGAERGVTSLVISTDLEELLALCDRIAVIFRGRVTGVVENSPGAEREVGRLMVGGDATAEAPAGQAAVPGGSR